MSVHDPLFHRRNPAFMSLAERLELLSDDEKAAWATELTESEAAALEWDWRFWGRPQQFAPPGDWSIWFVLAGRGFGKTRTGAEWVRENVTGSTPLARGKFRRLALVAETAADARDVMAEGPSGILATSPKDFRPDYEPSKRRLTWPNGAVATLYNATEPDQLRGPEHDGAWCDELAKWAYAQDAWDMLEFGLRTGKNPQVCVTTTPRPIPLVKSLLADPATVTTRGSTYDNVSNLAPKFIHRIRNKYEGTRLGRQEIGAEILDDVPGALWTRANFDKYRVRKSELPQLRRIVVAVDPSGTNGDGDDNDGDDIGIVVTALGYNGRGYVLADRTINAGPAEWARRACNVYSEFSAHELVAEINFGGAMVVSTIKTANPRVPVKVVRASLGKSVRAEPISALYEQGKISHVIWPHDERPENDSTVIPLRQFETRGLSALEDEMVNMTRDGYTGKGSPNRLDAAVWGFSELFIEARAGYDLSKAL